MTFKTIKVLHINFIKATFEQFIKQLEEDLKTKQNKFIVTANPEIVLYANDNPNYLELVNSADYVTPDGIGIVKAAKTLGTPIPERITGYDTLVILLKIANKNNLSIYFLGSKEEVISATVKKVKTDYPNIKIAGYHNGYFADDALMQEKIIDSTPDIVFAAVGFPKQEFFLNEMQKKRKSNALWMGVGGSFDVLSGTKKRAPQIFQNLHLEWAYRFITEPTRAKRMLAIPKFMIKIQQEKKHRD